MEEGGDGAQKEKTLKFVMHSHLSLWGWIGSASSVLECVFEEL